MQLVLCLETRAYYNPPSIPLSQLEIKIPLVQLQFASKAGLKRIPKKRPAENSKSRGWQGSVHQDSIFTLTLLLDPPSPPPPPRTHTQYFSCCYKLGQSCHDNLVIVLCAGGDSPDAKRHKKQGSPSTSSSKVFFAAVLILK